MDANTRDRIERYVTSKPVVLFMKGTRNAPRCGFSATVVSILDQLVEDYETVDVLADEEIRNGIKEYADWPTIPQLYVKGEFVGGCDIVKEMFGSGELEERLGVQVADVAPPHLEVSDSAAKALREAIGSGDEVIRLEIDDRFNHGLSLGAANPKDLVVTAAGVRIAMDRRSAARAEGAQIDYVDSPDGPAFKISNPNEPPKVKRLSVEDLKQRLEHEARLELFDVRTPREREIAAIDGSQLLDGETQKYIMGLPKDRPLVFVCHRGTRSQQAAEFFLNAGFRDVSNVEGGIDAWAQRIEPSMRRY